MRTPSVGRLSHRSRLSWWAAAVGLTAAAAFLVAPPRPGAAYVEDPAPGHTGGFGEPTCQACHFGDASNDAAGALRLEGAPERTEPGATHRLTVVLEHTGSERGGFQLAARSADGTPAGKLEPVDARARVTRLEETGLAYAHHTPQGTRTQEPGTFRWQLRWTAPDEPSGRVVFHLTANASNDDDSPFGDAIYSAEAQTVLQPRSAESTSQASSIENGRLTATVAP